MAENFIKLYRQLVSIATYADRKGDYDGMVDEAEKNLIFEEARQKQAGVNIDGTRCLPNQLDIYFEILAKEFDNQCFAITQEMVRQKWEEWQQRYPQLPIVFAQIKWRPPLAWSDHSHFRALFLSGAIHENHHR